MICVIFRYYDPGCAKAAIKNFDRSKIDGKRVRVRFSRAASDAPQIPRSNLYIKPLHPDVNSERLHQIFSQFGVLDDARGIKLIVLPVNLFKNFLFSYL
jgi:RNA recognition motif-containing protein